MGTRRRWLGLLVALAAVLLALPPAAASPAAASLGVGARVAPAPCSADDPFTPAVRAAIAGRYPRNRITAYVYDAATGCEFSYRPDLRITTASVVKLEVMAGVLLRAQSQGRDLNSYERDRIRPMITESANGPTSELWQYLGGVGAMQSLDRTFWLRQTTAVGPVWGLTETSASDQVYLVRQVLLGQFGPLSARSRFEALGYTTSVVPSQRWGITAGVPTSPGWIVAQKNGFADSGCCGWRINSVGLVSRPFGTPGYAVAILSDGWGSQPPGVAAIEDVNRYIAAALTSPPVGPFGTAYRFVSQAALDVLSHPLSADGQRFLTSVAGQGRSAAAVVAMFDDPELAFDPVLARLYLSAFGRAPDAAGFDYWSFVVRARAAAPTAAAESFASSPEFAARYGALDDGAYVDLLYDHVLGRPADPVGRAYWVGRLAAGRSRGEVLLALSETPEHVAATTGPVALIRVWRSLLRRQPTDAELSTLGADLQAKGVGLEPLVALTVASAPYAARFGA